MRTSNKIFIGFGVITGIIASILFLVFFLTAGIVTVADEFFVAIKNKDIDKAYLYLSDDFKSSTSRVEFEEFIIKNAMDQSQETNWSSREISGQQGSLKGSFITNNGDAVPISLDLLKSEGGWKIYSIRKPASGIQEGAAYMQVPDEEDQIMLVNGVMNLFAISVEKQDMTNLYQNISTTWKKQISVESLNSVFSPFYGLDNDLAAIVSVSPVFDSKSTINENGVLLISGLYPNRPLDLYFEHKYLYEGTGWKLLGLSVNIK